MLIIDIFSDLKISDYKYLTDLVSLITSILTLSIAFILGRQAFVRWRKQLSIYLIILWLSSILIYVKQILSLDILGFLPLIGLVLWLLMFILVLKIFYNILNIELIQFSKRNGLEFTKFVDNSFGSKCIDDAISDAINEQKKRLPDSTNRYQPQNKIYPLILAADEHWRPWNIAQKFVVNSILKGDNKAGVIYFTFTRPYDHIRDQLEYIIEKEHPEMADQLLNNLIIIDCFTPLSFKRSKQINYRGSLTNFFSMLAPDILKKSTINKGYLISDPRNPHHLNEHYEKSLWILKDKGRESICVVYDALSDFLCFTDEQLAIQYLRHNMFWEEKNKISSMYILRPNTVQNKFLDEYLVWFANSVFYLDSNLKSKEEKPMIRIRGLFQEPRCYEIDYNMCRVTPAPDLTSMPFDTPNTVDQTKSN